MRIKGIMVPFKDTLCFFLGYPNGRVVSLMRERAKKPLFASKQLFSSFFKVRILQKSSLVISLLKCLPRRRLDEVLRIHLEPLAMFIRYFCLRNRYFPSSTKKKQKMQLLSSTNKFMTNTWNYVFDLDQGRRVGKYGPWKTGKTAWGGNKKEHPRKECRIRKFGVNRRRPKLVDLRPHRLWYNCSRQNCTAFLIW